MKTKTSSALLVVGAIVVSFSNLAFAEEAFLLDLSANQKQDIVQILNQALKNHKSVKLSKGEYFISNPILLNADNILDLNGSKITKQGGLAALYNVGDPTEVKTGYNGNGFEVKNGIFDLNDSAGFAISHAPYGLIDGITFQNSNGEWTHTIELAGSKNVKIQNSIFDGHKSRPEFTDRKKEMIQIEYASRGAFDYFGAHDDTPSRDITISNNIFRNFHVALGNHYAPATKPIRNILVANNTFENPLYENSMAARLWDFDGVIFKDNKLGGANLYEDEGNRSTNIQIIETPPAPAEMEKPKDSKEEISKSVPQENSEKSPEKSKITAPKTGALNIFAAEFTSILAGIFVAIFAIRFSKKKFENKF